MNPIVWQILLQIILIALNAVFACAEIAVISVSDAKLAQLIAQGDKRAVRFGPADQPARPVFWPPFRSPLPCPVFWAAPSPRTTSPVFWWTACSVWACRCPPRP